MSRSKDEHMIQNLGFSFPFMQLTLVIKMNNGFVYLVREYMTAQQHQNETIFL